MDFLFIAGAPGSGKSTLARVLHQRLNSPMFEFAWIPEFRLDVYNSQAREEALSFENLVWVVKNYVRHGYQDVIVTDLNDLRHRELHLRFGRYKYLLLTLVVEDDDLLRRRVLDESRPSGYRDAEAAIRHNRMIMGRSLLPSEYRLDNTNRDLAEVLGEAMALIEEPPPISVLPGGKAFQIPKKEAFGNYLSSE